MSNPLTLNVKCDDVPRDNICCDSQNEKENADADFKQAADPKPDDA